MEPFVLGLPLDRALALLRAQGIEPEVSVTRAPGDRREGTGTLRVVRFKENILTVADFHDGAPAEKA